MKIEAVTVSVGYGDFLAETLANNLSQVDRLIVVTTEDDMDTRNLCHAHDVEYVLSDAHLREAGGVGGGKFNKGAMIEQGLMQCSTGDDFWRLHWDADIFFPAQMKRLLENACDLEKHKLYGCDRMMFRSWEEWQAAKSTNWMHHTNCSINMPQTTPIGTRYALAQTGWVPIGFWQLWHSSADEGQGRRHRAYPITHGDAHRSDVQFSMKWPRKHRVLLPEIVVAHLESEHNRLGENWNGRKTKPFGPYADLCPVDPNYVDPDPEGCS